RVVRTLAVRVRLNGFVESKRHSVRVRPIGRGHPPIVPLNDSAVGAIVRGEPNDGARRESAWKLENVSNGRSAKPIQALVFVTDDAKVASLFGELQQNLLLNVVRVLILIHHRITDL